MVLEVKILITGTTARHIGNFDVFREGYATRAHYCAGSHIFRRCLEKLGHDVDMRPVNAQETLRQYDRVFVYLSPLADPPTTYIFSALTALVRRRDAVIMLDDWKVGPLYGSFRRMVMRNHHYLWRSIFASSRPGFPDAFARRKKYEDLVHRMSDGPWKNLVVVQIFPWANHATIKGCPPSRERAYLDLSSMALLPKVDIPKRRKKAWVAAVLGPRSRWIEKQDFRWPVVHHGHKQDRVSEDVVVQQYASHRGVLVPKYPHHGWYRPRIHHAAHVGAVVFGEDHALIESAPDIHGFTAAQIERMTGNQLDDLALAQARWFRANTWPRTALLDEVDRLVDGTIRTLRGDQ